jgi:ribosomal protein S18 acetylase RimI-like enzyme
MGTTMMKEMLGYLKNAGYSKTSLAVQKDNYALKMYLSVGFHIINENTEEYIMMHYLK